jgi:hypothetical protein
VVGIFPDRAAVIRLVGAVLAEQHDVRAQLDVASGSDTRHDVPAWSVAFRLRVLLEVDRRAMSLDRSGPAGFTHVFAAPDSRSLEEEADFAAHRYRRSQGHARCRSSGQPGPTAGQPHVPEPCDGYADGIPMVASF